MVKETDHLTVLDMLDALETEIGLLLGQNRSLAAALSDARDQGAAPLAGTPMKKRAGARKAKKKAPKRKAIALEPKAAAGSGDHVPKEDRLGKRQALGSRCLQLRRHPPAPQPERSDVADGQQDLFHR